MILACSTCSFPRDRLEIAIAKVAWAGFRGIELEFAGEPPAEEWLRERLRNNELVLVTIRAGELGAGDPEATLARSAEIGRLAQLAHRLDASRVVVTAPAHGEFAALTEGLRMLLDALQAIQSEVAVANAAGTLVATPDDLARLRRAVPSPRHGFALDPAAAIRVGWDPADASHWPCRPTLVYLTDVRDGATVPPGTGEVDWPRLAAVLRRAGFDGPIVLRLGGAPDYAVEPAAKEARVAAEEWFEIGWR